MNKSSSTSCEMPPWVIFHIPHDSTVIPSEVRDQFVLNDKDLSREIIKMTDHHTYDLIARIFPTSQIVKFPVSRLVVDVERFESDCDEYMAARGMGVIYKSTHELKPLRRLLSTAEREHLLSKWYRPHHALLTGAVDKALNEFRRALVIDVHSFPSLPLPYETDLTAYRPEICIGSDSYHSPVEVVHELSRGFELHGFEVGINTPFAGAIVTAKHYKKDERVQAVMIEIRRDLYLDESTGFLNEGSTLVQERLKSSLLQWLTQSGEMEPPFTDSSSDQPSIG
ncbi:MAG: N-formylglutamate amidohydrolase [Betaproteobacteria bacterium]